MKPEDSLPSSQKLVFCVYPEPDEPNTQHLFSPRNIRYTVRSVWETFYWRLRTYRGHSPRAGPSIFLEYGWNFAHDPSTETKEPTINSPSPHSCRLTLACCCRSWTPTGTPQASAALWTCILISDFFGLGNVIVAEQGDLELHRCYICIYDWLE